MLDTQYVNRLCIKFQCCCNFWLFLFRISEIPSWSGLNHFSGIMKTEFADGSKYEDISKVSSVTPLLRWQVVIIYQIIVFAAHNILSKNVSKEGFHLLKLIRSYLELDMYVSLTVHTESTIAAGRAELLVFERLLHVSKILFNRIPNLTFLQGIYGNKYY